MTNMRRTVMQMLMIVYDYFTFVMKIRGKLIRLTKIIGKMRKCCYKAYYVLLYLLGAITLLICTPAIATGCPSGGIEVGRKITDEETIIYCKHITELSEGEVRSLSREVVSSLPAVDRELLRMRRHELGIVIVVSPSLIISPEERDFLIRQLEVLKSKRERMEIELAKIHHSREIIDQAAAYNAQVIHDLTADSISHSLNVLEGGLYIYGGAVPAETMEKIKAALIAAKATTNGIAAATSKADSERQALKLAETLLTMKNLIPAQVIGIDSREWKAIRQIVDTFPKLIEISQRIAATPNDKSLWRDWEAYLDDIVAIGGKFSVPVKSIHSAGNLLVIKWALSSLKDDRKALQEAGSGSQTAQRYWVTRIGEVIELEKFYQIRLAGGEAVEDELEGL